jgi:putative hydrolase of the HAD superfamily
MMPSVVFFDAGDTLIHPEPSVGEVYAHAARTRGISCDAREVEKAFAESWSAERIRRGGQGPAYGATEKEARTWWASVVRRTVHRFGYIPDFGVFFDELWTHFARPSAWRIYDDVPAALNRLERLGVRVGLISNWDIRLPDILRGLGLWHRFDPRIVSFRAGTEKPDPAIFRRALKLSGVGPDAVAHVGDSYYEDAEGARRAGIRPVLLCRDGGDEHLPCSVTCIRSLRQLSARLR